MKAIICEEYGSPEVLKMVDVTVPKIRDDEILVKNMAASVSIGDVLVRGLGGPAAGRFFLRLMFGLLRPRRKILGLQFAGIVEKAGDKVTEFKPGDKVYGTTGMKMGCYAQYVKVAEKGAVVKMPDMTDFNHAVPVGFGAMTALHLLRPANISPGQKVLIYGASGAVGTYAVQIAKYYAAEVTAVCGERNFDMIKSLGASRAIDYKKEDFAQSGPYDVVFDAVNKIAQSHAQKALNPGGKFISVKSMTSETKERLLALNHMIEEGKLVTVIDKTYPLEDIPEAHAYAETGHKSGNLVIEIEHEV